MHVKLGPHRWVEVERDLTGDGWRIVREYPCVRAVLYDAVGRIIAAHHACFQAAIHLDGMDNPFDGVPPSGGYLRLDRFPIPCLKNPRWRDVVYDAGGHPRAIEGAADEDDLARIVNEYVVDLVQRRLVRRSP